MKIVVVGGGYAGTACALRLGAAVQRARLRATIVLVNPSATFVERIRLHQAATGQHLARRSLSSVLAPAGVRLITARADAIDLARSRIIVDDRALAWDRLVLALGSTIARPAIPGVAEHAVPLDASHLSRLRARLLELPSQSRVVVVGTGLTGIEFAAEIADRLPHLRVTLAGRDALLPTWSAAAAACVREHFSRQRVEIHSGTEVVAVQQDRLLTSAGMLPADLCVWTAGFGFSDLARRAGLATDAAGRVLVDGHLRSISNERVNVAGDYAAPVLPPGHPLPMGCKSALPTGVYAADELIAQLRGREQAPLDIAVPFYCVSLGRDAGLIQMSRADGSSTGRVLRERPAAWVKEVVSRSTWWSMTLEARGIRAVRWARMRAGTPSLAPCGSQRGAS